MNETHPVRKKALDHQPLSYQDVTISDSFWSPRIRLVMEHTIPYQYEQCKATGRIDAFRLDWKIGLEPKPHFFWDSDIAKWVEAASYSLGLQYNAELDQLLDGVIALITSAQQPDGYLNVYFTVVEPERRWKDLRDGHELYCAGHLIEAAIAHYQATGKRTLLDVMCRYADHIDSIFGEGQGKKRGYCGHEEIELALVKLYRVTGIERYLRLSEFFINERGTQPYYYDLEAQERGTPNLFDEYIFRVGSIDVKEHVQSHMPVREQMEAVGHAVRAMYLYCGMADLAAELGDQSLVRACERLWQHVAAKRMYITGGIGSSAINEGFTSDYDLPNETAYCETCASIGMVMFNHRMLQLDCDRKYADLMERALYNGVISGMSQDGQKFFYANPLASDGTIHRQEWFGCSCCPPNIARLLTSLGEYVYGQNDSEVIIHLYVQGEGRFRIQGQEVILHQSTQFPWDGQTTITVELDHPDGFGIKLRIPEWCSEAKAFINGCETDMAKELDKGYTVLNRTWENGDTIHLL
ncbi:MAG TPA: beta-L-arabinofuranosidase domain-containing protein, partial [Bacilli bacterium]